MNEKFLQKLKRIPGLLLANLRIIGLLLGVAALVFAVVWVRPWVKQKIRDYRVRKQELPHEYIEYATNVLVKTERYDEAFKYLQAAIDKMTLPEDRALAGLAMGEFLLERARKEPVPYAQMARGYIIASLNLEEKPERKVRMYRALADIAKLLDDQKTALDACVRAEKLAVADDVKVEFLLRQLDILLKTGTWEQFYGVWKDSERFRKNERYEVEFEMREARMYEKVLTSDVWYHGYLNDVSPASDPATVRSSILNRALKLCDSLAQKKPEEGDSVLFLAAQLCAVENRFSDARERIREFFEKNYRTHQEDILLMLIRMARLEGKMQQSEELITQFLRRYQWFSRASEELLAVIEQAESVGHYQEALDILNEYLQIPSARDDIARLSFKAGELASRLQLYDQALKHFQVVLEHNPDDEMYVSTLLAMGEINLQIGEYKEAQDLLIRALTGFPYDPKRGSAFYKMVDVFRRSDASLADRLLMTSLAVDIMKNDPKVVNLLMQLARNYEELGLYDDAQENYAKVALLRTVDSLGREKAPSTERILEALLGSARCLIKMNTPEDTLRADRLLRELCQNAKAGEVFSQAAYLWAGIAFNKSQYQEAQRRLSLIDLTRCDPNLRTKVELDRLLLDVAEGKRAPESAVDALSTFGSLSRMEKLEFARRANTLCFERMLKEKNTKGMQEFIDALAPDSRGLPVGKWVMELASTVMQQHGTNEFVKCLEKNRKYIRPEDDHGLDVAGLVALAESVENVTSKVDKYKR